MLAGGLALGVVGAAAGGVGVAMAEGAALGAFAGPPGIALGALAGLAAAGFAGAGLGGTIAHCRNNDI